MNEQELADLLSEQIERMLQGETDLASTNIEDLQGLLDLGERFSQTQFQASSAARATFQSQIAGWFGATNGGAPTAILGLSKVWLISIIITVVVVITGLGFIAAIATNIFIFSHGEVVVVSSAEATEEAGPPTVETTPAMTTTVISPVLSGTITTTVTPDGAATPEPSSTTEPEGAPNIAPPNTSLTLLFRSELRIAHLCQGAYVTQRTLVNYSDAPIDAAALVWEVTEGSELVNEVNISSPVFEEPSAENGAGSNAAVASSPQETTVAPIPVTDASIKSFANFGQIAAQEELNLDVKIKVNDAWWQQPDGTQIKVKLFIKNKIILANEGDNNDGDDLDRGHGNDSDSHDEDNPGQAHGPDDDRLNHSHIITIIKQGSEWVTLSGPAHYYDPQTLLIDGHIVAINSCTGLPPQLPPGAQVQIVGALLPNGTFIAINITVIDVNIINVNFNSGMPVAPSGGGDDDGDSGSSGGGGGGGRSDDHDRGHGNDSDGFDEDNPGKSHR